MPQVVQDHLDQEIERFPRLKEISAALLWRLAREPEAGAAVPGFLPPRYLIRSLYRHPLPLALVFLYSYTEEDVFIELCRIDETPT